VVLVRAALTNVPVAAVQLAPVTAHVGVEHLQATATLRSLRRARSAGGRGGTSHRNPQSLGERIAVSSIMAQLIKMSMNTKIPRYKREVF
jgi:hypothetical protein